MSKVDDYIADATWSDELARLRRILKTTGLEETTKWGMPYYTDRGTSIVGMASFKTYFGLWFSQGALLRDEESVLINAQEGKTRAMRQWRMRSARDIRAAAIKRYVRESVENARAGKKVKPAPPRDVEVPPELELALKAQNGLRAFGRLRPAQQGEFARYVGEAKRAETKARRIEKILPLIKAGSGLNDRYRKR